MVTHMLGGVRAADLVAQHGPPDVGADVRDSRHGRSSSAARAVMRSISGSDVPGGPSHGSAGSCP